MKKYLIGDEGKSLLFWMNDLMNQEDVKNLPITNRCSSILWNAMVQKSFESLSDEDARIIFKELVEPVSYKDINLLSISESYVEVHNACGRIWISLPDKVKNEILNF